MDTHGELVSTHMPKKSQVENWLHECQLLASVMLPLGGTVWVSTPLDIRLRGSEEGWSTVLKLLQRHLCV